MAMDDLTIIAAVAVFVLAVHAVFAVYLYRTLSDATVGSNSDFAGSSDGDRPGEREMNPDGTRAGWELEKTGRSGGDTGPDTIDADAMIACPACGVRNDPQYQFCRRCISELSGDGSPTPR